jgi:hypothetical protein
LPTVSCETAGTKGNIAHKLRKVSRGPHKSDFAAVFWLGWHRFVCFVRLPSFNFIKSEVGMEIEKDRITTQEETGEPAPIDQVEERVEAEMKILEGEAKKQVADGLQNEGLAREAEQLQKEGERELEQAKDQ